MIRNFIGRFFHIFSVASNGTAQLTDCKAASGKDQQRTVWREAAHRYDLPAQGAEGLLRPLRKQKVKQQQGKRQMVYRNGGDINVTTFLMVKCLL